MIPRWLKLGAGMLLLLAFVETLRAVLMGDTPDIKLVWHSALMFTLGLYVGWPR